MAFAEMAKGRGRTTSYSAGIGYKSLFLLKSKSKEPGEKLSLRLNCRFCLKMTSCWSSTSLPASPFMKRKRSQNEKQFWVSWKINIEARGFGRDSFIDSIKIPPVHSWCRRQKNPLRNWKTCLRKAKSKKNIFA